MIPRLPTWNEVAIVEATEDFKKDYRFEIDSDRKDYGHIFPAQLIGQFVRTNEHVSGDIRSTLKNVSRFWNINHCADAIEQLLKQPEHELRNKQSFENRFHNTLNNCFSSNFDKKKFGNDLYERLNEQLSNEEWEYGLVEGLRKIYPAPFVVERTGGILEKEHGTDILIKFPDLLGSQYAIAIQVKDYQGVMSGDAIKQISKADAYWNKDNLTLIDKYVIVTKCKKEDNAHLNKLDESVKFVFANDLQELLVKMGLSEIGFNLENS